MGNGNSRYRQYLGFGPAFGSTTYHALYGGNRRRRRDRILSTRSTGQVEEAKNLFLHFVFETDFDFMSKKAKLKKQIFGHMTKDARNAVREYIKSMNATVVFRANPNRYRGQNRVFHGSVTITKGTKNYIIENKPEAVRPLYIIAELALCTLLCFAGIPHNDAQGWILPDIEEKEFEEIKDIEQFLDKKALVWKKPIHCTKYSEFAGKEPTNLKDKLRDRHSGKTPKVQKMTDIFRKSSNKKKIERMSNNNTNNNNTNNNNRNINKIINEKKEEESEDDEDDDLLILNDENKNTSNNKKRTLDSYWSKLHLDERPSKKRKIRESAQSNCQ